VCVPERRLADERRCGMGQAGQAMGWRRAPAATQLARRAHVYGGSQNLLAKRVQLRALWAYLEVVGEEVAGWRRGASVSGRWRWWWWCCCWLGRLLA
jgi:hypothetical protein